MSLAVGVDLGGTKIAAGVVDEDGVVLATVRRETPAGVPAVIEAIVELVSELTSEWRSGSSPEGDVDPGMIPVGVGAAGFVDAGRHRVLFAPNLDWADVPLADAIAERLGVRVVLENDANAAAWAEARFGAGERSSSMVLVTVGTGIGGGIVLDGALYRGGFGVAGEFGHLPLVAGGRECGCGQSGCWEQYASGNALSRAAREQLGILDVAAAIQSADPAALELLSETGRWLGAGLAGVAALLDPAVIVVGGGVSANGDLLLGPARAEFRRRLPAGEHRPFAEIRVARLGPAAGIVGAADLARPRIGTGP